METHVDQEWLKMITSGHGKKENAANQAAEPPFEIETGGELQLTAELAEALRHRELM